MKYRGKINREEYRMAQDIGGIYTDDKCPICERNYVDDGIAFLLCPAHPSYIASRFKVKIRGTTARFWDYYIAKRYLESMRKSVADGTFDRPKLKTIGHVQDAFLEWKEDLVKMGKLQLQSVNTYRNRLNRIVHVLGVAKDASSVRYRHVHEFLYKGGFSPKSTYDSYTVFKEMYEWAFDMGDLTAKPKWPPFDFSLEHDMKRRKTVDKETQARILHTMYLAEWDIRPRLYLGVRFLATYINLRPKELLGVTERDFNRQEGYIVIREHKTSRRPKIVRLTQQDISLLKELPRGMSHLPLFRHDVPCGGIKAGDGFGQAAFYRAWKRACGKLGIKDVDLYGGTRHSSAVALYKDAGVSPEEIQKATGHKSSVAFTRYFKLDLDDVLEIHALAGPPEPVGRDFRYKQEDKSAGW
jgi:integrase